MPNRERREQIRRTAAGIDSQRPLFAFDCIADIGEHSPDHRKNYKSYVQKLPAFIQSNGLGQTLGFMYSKSSGTGSREEMYDALLSHIREYLCFRGVLPEQPDTYSNQRFIHDVIQFDVFTYYQAEEETLLLIKWLRRFAEGTFGGEN